MCDLRFTSFSNNKKKKRKEKKSRKKERRKKKILFKVLIRDNLSIERTKIFLRGKLITLNVNQSPLYQLTCYNVYFSAYFSRCNNYEQRKLNPRSMESSIFHIHIIILSSYWRAYLSSQLNFSSKNASSFSCTINRYDS